MALLSSTLLGRLPGCPVVGSSLRSRLLQCTTQRTHASRRVLACKAQQQDTLLRSLSELGELAVLVVDGTQLVSEAARRHKTAPTATAALGRTLMGALLMGSFRKEDEQVQISFKGDGLLGGVMAIADTRGNVKGKVGNVAADPPLRSDGKLNVGEAVGAGSLSVVRSHPLEPQPYTGIVPITSGEIAEDLATYLATSEQTNSAVGLGVSLSRDCSVRSAGGYLVQVLPFCSDETLDQLEKNMMGLPSMTDMLNSGMTPSDITERILEGLGRAVGSTNMTPRYGPCDSEALKGRMMRAVASLGEQEVRSIIADVGKIEVTCEMCNESYQFEEEAVLDLVQSCLRPSSNVPGSPQAQAEVSVNWQQHGEGKPSHPGHSPRALGPSPAVFNRQDGLSNGSIVTKKEATVSFAESTGDSQQESPKACRFDLRVGGSSPSLTGRSPSRLRLVLDASDVKETPKLCVDSIKGNVFVNQYLIIRDLGRGAHGTVKLCINTDDDTLCAMKVIQKRKARRNSYLMVAQQRRSMSVSSDPGAIAAFVANLAGAGTPGGTAQSPWATMQSSASGISPSATPPGGVSAVSSRKRLLSTMPSNGGSAGGSIGTPGVLLTPQQSLGQTGASMMAAAAAAMSSSSAFASPASTVSLPCDPLLAELQKEMAVMKKLDHPHVVKLYEVIHDPEQKQMVMIMEYLPGGSILTSTNVPGQTEPLSEDVAVLYFRDVLQGLDYLHTNHVMHGDLKPDNLLLSAAGAVKISDFGSCMVVEPGATVSLTLGTPAFMAPEMCQLRSQPYKPFVAEMWALGVCLYIFIYGTAPFQAETTVKLYEKIRESEVLYPETRPISASLRSLLEGLLCKDPEQRMDISAVLAHDWFNQEGQLPRLVTCAELNAGAEPLHPDSIPAAEARTGLTALTAKFKQLPNIEEKTFRKGDLLIRAGEPAEGLFLIQEGMCQILQGEQLVKQRQALDRDFAEKLQESESSQEDDTDDASSLGSFYSSYQGSSFQQGGSFHGTMQGGGVPYTGAHHSSPNAITNTAAPSLGALAAHSGSFSFAPGGPNLADITNGHASSFPAYGSGGGTSPGGARSGVGGALGGAAASLAGAMSGAKKRRSSWAVFGGKAPAPEDAQASPRSLKASLELSQASAPDLRDLMRSSANNTSASARSPFAHDAALGVQRSAASCSSFGGRGAQRVLARTPSMHARMMQMVNKAKARGTKQRRGSMDLVAPRGPGDVVGDLYLSGPMTPSPISVKAKTKVKVLLIRKVDVGAIRHQPAFKAVVARSQTESSVSQHLDRFVSYQEEMVAADELRRSATSMLSSGPNSFTSASHFASAPSNCFSNGPGPSSLSSSWPGPGAPAVPAARAESGSSMQHQGSRYLSSHSLATAAGAGGASSARHRTGSADTELPYYL